MNALTINDTDRALALCAALCPTSDSMQMVVIPGDPYSKSRPRFSRNGRTYVKSKDREQEERTRVYLRRSFKEPLTGNVALGCIFFRPNRRRIDADNMLKHVCDAANGVVYIDDSQVTAIMAIVELDIENPRTVVMVGSHQSTLGRGSDDLRPCERCGTPICFADERKRFCSKECASASRGRADLSGPVPCQTCGSPFRRLKSTQKYCSRPCGRAALRKQPQQMEVPSV